VNIKVENLFFTYTSMIAMNHEALMGISLEVPSGKITAIVGAAGSGKTTLIQHFNGLLLPQSGKIFIDNIDIFSNNSTLEEVRKKTGIVFQFPEYQFFEEKVFDEVAFGPRNQGLSDDEVENRVIDAINAVGLDFEKYRLRSPFVLSGGEKRRVAIASILAMKPQILVMDEPTVGLDPVSAKIIEEIMTAYQKADKTVVFVSHNMDLVSRIADKVIVLKKGRKIYEGTKEGLFKDSELIDNAGLTLPEIYRFMNDIKKRGFDVNPMIFTIEEAKQEILKAIKMNRRYGSSPRM